jgi:hypothetical protein
LHIPALRPNKFKKWIRAEEKLLGTAEDKVIAARLGRTWQSVVQHRRILGIPPRPRIFPNAWTTKQDALFGQLPDREIATRLNRSVSAVGVNGG